MSKQKTSKSGVSQEIIEIIKSHFSEEVNDVRFRRAYRNKKGFYEEFKVNNHSIVTISNRNRFEGSITIEQEEERKKLFKKRVNYLIKEADITWNLAKMTVKKFFLDNCRDEDFVNDRALNYIGRIKECVDIYQNVWQHELSFEEYCENFMCIEVGYHFSEKQIQIIKEYWLAKYA